MFIHLEDSYNDIIIVNLNLIAYINKNALTIIISGNHGEQNGLINITLESMKRLLNIVKENIKLD